MSMTRPPSPEASRRRSHCINIGSIYTRVANARYAERYRGELPDSAVVAMWQRTLDEHSPPEEFMARKHSIASRQIARWRRAASSQEQEWQRQERAVERRL